MKYTLIVGGVAKETNGDFIAAFELYAFGDTSSQRERAAYQGVTAHEPVGYVKNMHRTTAAFGATGFLAIELCHDNFRVCTALNGMDVIAITGDDVIVAGAGGFHYAVATGFLAGI